jgi:hypothetical protein
MSNKARTMLVFIGGAVVGVAVSVVVSIWWSGVRYPFVLTQDLAVGTPPPSPEFSTLQAVVRAGTAFKSRGRKGDINYLEFPVVAVSDRELAGRARSRLSTVSAPWESHPGKVAGGSPRGTPQGQAQ